MLSVTVSCGFHLRGDVEIPSELKTVYITGIAEHDRLYQEIKQQIQNSGSRVSTLLETADSQIRIQNDEFRKRVLSVDAFGRAAEYELTYSFQFSVLKKGETKTDGGGQSAGQKVEQPGILVPVQKISYSRDFRFDPDNVLATEALEQRISQELIRVAVQQMFYRIRFQLIKKTQG